jgi:long-chain fatty acid transport protein
MSMFEHTNQSARRAGRPWKFCATALCVAVLAAPTTVRAGSIDYLTNQSADFMRTLGRNSATDAADVAYHNPAGTAFLPNDGLYLSLSSQTLLKFYSIDYNGTKFEADDPTPVLPSLYVLYKWKHLAGFFNFTIPAGGGDLTYEEGVPYLEALALVVPDKDSNTPTEMIFEGSSMYLGFTLGAAYEFGGIVSVAAAARLVHATKTFSGSAMFGTKKASLDAEKKALGVGGIFGVHVRPFKYLDIGIRYETETALDWETTGTTVNLKTDKGSALESFGDGATETRPLPGLLGLGISGHLPGPLDMLTLNVNYNLYFIKAADKDDDVRGMTGYVIGYDDDYDDGMEVSASIEAQVIDSLLISAGYARAWLGGNEQTYSDFEYALDAHSGAFGARLGVLGQRLKITAAFVMTFYDEGQNETLHPLLKLTDNAPPETFDKKVFTFALGIEYRFLGPDVD